MYIQCSDRSTLVGNISTGNCPVLIFTCSCSSIIRIPQPCFVGLGITTVGSSLFLLGELSGHESQANSVKNPENLYQTLRDDRPWQRDRYVPQPKQAKHSLPTLVLDAGFLSLKPILYTIRNVPKWPSRAPVWMEHSCLDWIPHLFSRQTQDG